LSATAQTDDVLSVADSMPKFPGGNIGIAKFIQMNLIVPPYVRETSSAEKTFVKFIVDTNGQVLNPTIIKASGFRSFDDEAIRVVSKMPLWQPGFDKNKKVKVYMNLPISYKNLGVVNAPEITKEHKQAMEYYSEGHKFDQEDKYKEALEKFNQVLIVEPENVYALFDKAKMHRLLGDKVKACEIWNKMVSTNIRKDEANEEIKKNCDPATINVPVNLVKEKEEREANKKAAEFFSQGMLSSRQERYESALHKFDSCLKYTPNHKAALFNKAAMHYKLDQKKYACSAWNKLILLDKTDKEVEELIKKNCN
jgi:TonB family protein